MTSPVHAGDDVAPDGKHFVILKSTGPEAQLIIVHDWTYELRARTAGSVPRERAGRRRHAYASIREPAKTGAAVVA